MTAALEGAEWSAARPGRTLHPGKTRYPFYRRLGGPQGRYGRAENLVPTGIRSRTVQPVVAIPTELPGIKNQVSTLIYQQFSTTIPNNTIINSKTVLRLTSSRLFTDSILANKNKTEI